MALPPNPDHDSIHHALGELGYATPTSVADFQRDHHREPTGVLDLETIVLVRDALAAHRIGERHGHRPPCHAVKGTISSTMGEPAPGLEVRLVEVAFRRENVLGTAKTDGKGRYEIAYPRDAASGRALVVRALDANEVVAESAPQFQPPPLLTIDLTVDPIRVHAPTEYEKLLADVQERVGNVTIASLREDEQSHDISLLSGLTGWPADKLVDLVVAHRLHDASSVTPALFYALLRQGALLGTGSSRVAVRTAIDLSTPIQPLFYDAVLLPESATRAAVQAAIGARVVPAKLTDDLTGILATLAKSRADAEAYVQTKQPQQLLAAVTANIAAGKHAELLDVLDEHGNGDLATLLAKIDAIEFVSPSTAGDGSDSASGALSTLLRADPQLLGDLQSLLGASATPAARPTATARFAADAAARAPENATDTATIAELLRNNPQFDLASGNVDDLLAKATATNASAAAGLRDRLKATQRVFKLAPTHRQTTALLDAGVHSAAQIAAMGRAAFVGRFTGNGVFTPTEAATVFAKATDIHTAAGLLAAELRSMSGASAAALTSPEVADKLAAVAKDNPNLKSLFQLIDLCECKDCNAIDSPAAYLVDVLQFIENRLVVDTTVATPIATKSAKDVLFARRPDLGDIDLSCDNTNVPLPYIDVVCELLEQVVSPDPGVAYAGALAPGVAPAALVSTLQTAGWDFSSATFIQAADVKGNLYARDAKAVAKLVPGSTPTAWTAYRLRQTFRTAAEFAAAPEYVEDAAYGVLQNAQIAFHLPFDLPHEEARAYFKQFDVPRDELMRALAVGGVPADRDIAADALDISDVERSLVVTAAPASQNVYWNTGATDPATVMNEVDKLLDRTELQYSELQDLLQRAFINPTGNLFIQHQDASCDLSKQTIANLDDAALDRIHRFLRLRRRLGWSIVTLDRAIIAPRIGNGSLDDACLVQIAALAQLHARLGVSVDDLVVYYGTIPTEGDPSRYAQLFVNTSANGIVEPLLAIAAVQQNQLLPPASQKHLVDVKDALALALGVKADDIQALVDASTAPPLDAPPLTPPPPTLANDVLSFGGLAALYAQISLAHALHWSVADLVILEQLTKINPLESPTATARFVAESDRVHAAGIKPVDLRFLLAFPASDIARGLKDATLTALLTGLQAALQDAFEQNRSPYDDSRTADENKGALRDVVGKLPGIATPQLAKLESIVDNDYVDPTVTAAQFIQDLLGPFVDTTAIVAAQATLAAAPPPQVEADRKALIRTILDTISAYLYRQARDAAVVAALAGGLRLDATMTTVLLGHAHKPGTTTTLGDVLGADTLIDEVHTPPQPPTITPGAFADQYAAVRAIRQIATFVATMPALTPDDVAWLLDHAATLGWLELDRLPSQPGLTAVPYTQWASLQDFVGLVQRYPAVANPDDAAAPFTYESLFAAALDSSTTPAQLFDLLAMVTGWDRAVVGDLDARFGFSTPDLSAYRDPSTHLRLERAVVLLRKLGLGVADGVKLIKLQLTAPDAQLLRLALKSRYADADWLGVLKQIYDPLRQLKRDALVAWVLANNPDLRSSDDLFDYFLVDVEMCSCQPTSRIVSAHGTLQLFVQRCLLGIEPTAVADVAADDGWTQWTWMEQYRLWQANRQVFLYPENWIDPTLRDDKSEPFVALEQALQQSALSEQSIEDAAIGYLEALDDLAFLEVVTMYYEQRTYTMHVFARTKGGDPATYYHRQFIEEKTWTPWVKVDLDIKGNHLLAFIRNGRLNLAWVIFTAKPNEDQKHTIPADTSPGAEVQQKTEQFWQIQLAVSELTNGKWSPSKTSQNWIQWPPIPTQNPLPSPDLFRFVALDLRQQGFAIVCTLDVETEALGGTVTVNPYLGFFRLAGCKGYPEATSFGYVFLNLLFFPQFDVSDIVDERFCEKVGGAQLTIMTYLLRQWVEILGKTPDRFRVTYPQQLGLIDYLLFLIAMVQKAAAAKATSTGFETMSVRVPPPLPIPLGTFMPYFFEDGFHNYVVVPGFFSSDVIIEGSPPPRTRRTLTDVVRVLQDLITLAKVYLQKLAQDPNHDINKLLQELLQDPVFIALREEVLAYANLSYGIEFDNFYHPLVCPLRKTLYNDGIDRLMARATQLQTTPFDFGKYYGPQPLVETPYPIEDIDFGTDGVLPVPAYASYNWELFFHLPFEIATRLSQDQQFEEALRWFHYIFNPMDASNGTVPQKYWRTKPFFLRTTDEYVAERIDSIMNGLDTATGGALDSLKFAVEQWREHPYQPFVVARSRTVAFQQAVLMKYLDNLIAWGDSLFTQDTMESVNQATQMYILADKLLGERPRIVPPLVTPPTETYNQLQAKSIDVFGNAMLDLENLIPDLSLLPHGGAELPPPPLTLSSLYFCIPPNPTLLKYWDTVADRLFKIRHCQDISGVERTLALFAPPIDPGALVRAAAQGISLGQLLQGLNAPTPFYRFSVMSQKAAELTQLVVSLGSSILQALEKRDAEALSRLRQTQEISLQNALIAVKQQGLADAQAQLDVLQRSIDLTTAKSQYYHSREFMNASENLAMTLNAAALVTSAIATGIETGAAIAKLIPEFSIGAAGFGGSPQFDANFGGDNIAGAASAFAGVTHGIAGIMQSGAGLASTLASYQRRQEEWDFQATLADKELVQLQSQMSQARIKVQMAQADLDAQQLQLANAQKTDAFLRGKFTNQELYEYMVGQLSAVYLRAYQLALDVAHKAERCYQHELGAGSNFIQYTYWDNRRKGLLAGDRLLNDLRQMETSYLAQNKREHELTKNVSLAMLDAAALLQLQNTGVCTFSLPEAIFDLDHPGHYFRRLKTVALTVPCVAGPYTSVSCKLSLVGNRYRKSTNPSATTPPPGYAEDPGNDDRFTYNVGTIQSVSTSQAQNDSGLFELSFRDDRYLPFEGQGAISSWRLEMPQTFRQFDYQTITDVIIHVRYTARDGGSGFRDTVEGVLATQLQQMLVDAGTAGLYQGFNARLEFPDSWYRFQQTNSVALTVSADFLPYFTKGHTPAIAAATWYARIDGDPATFAMQLDGTPFTLSRNTALKGLCSGSSGAMTLDTPFTLSTANAALIKELTLVVNYTLGS